MGAVATIGLKEEEVLICYLKPQRESRSSGRILELITNRTFL
jgi:hypothetical protein